MCVCVFNLISTDGHKKICSGGIYRGQCSGTSPNLVVGRDQRGMFLVSISFRNHLQYKCLFKNGKATPFFLSGNVLLLDIWKHKAACKKLHNARQRKVEAVSNKKNLAKNR